VGPIIFLVLALLGLSAVPVCGKVLCSNLQNVGLGFAKLWVKNGVQRLVVISHRSLFMMVMRAKTMVKFGTRFGTSFMW